MTRQGCAETVWDNLRLEKYPCSRGGTIERESKYWCYQHDPEAVAKRQASQRAKWGEENRQRAEANRRLAAERLAVGFLSTDALEAGIVKATVTSHDQLINAARAAAVELRDLSGPYQTQTLSNKLRGIAQTLESALKEAHSG